MNPRTLRKISLLIIFALILVACGARREDTPSPPVTRTNELAPSETTTLNPTPSIPPTASPTIASPLAFLIKPSGTGLSQADQIESALSSYARSAGLRFQVRSSLEPGDLDSDVHYVVALPPDPGLADLAAAAPETQFLGIGIAGLQPLANLTTITPQGSAPDEIGFLAGYIAAVVSPEWRVGVISTSDDPSGIAARNGFLNGVVYFCGLCRQTHPPYYDYPLYAEVPSGASTTEWQVAADTLRDRLVRTVYVAPGAGDPSLLEYLAQADLNIIASTSPPDAIRNHWIASLGPDYLQAFQEAWPEIVDGNAGANLPVSIQINQVNEDIFTPGRQQLVQEFLIDLQSGYIDTGVDPTTGQPR